MSDTNIQQLLEKYYKGETSIEEESALKLYFLEEKGEELSVDRMVFNSVNDSFNEIEIPENLSADLSAMIDNLDRQSVKHKTVRMIVSSVAALALLVLGIAIFYEPKLPDDIYTANVEMTEEEALAQFQKSMAMLSEGFEKSYDSYRKADEAIHYSIEKLESVLK